MLIRAAYAQDGLPSFPVEFIQKNQSGPQYQVGDRIQLSVRITPELSQDIASIKLLNPDEKNPLDKQGWFLDPSPQIINGNLRFIASPIKTGKLTLPELHIVKNEGQTIAKTVSLNIEVAELKAEPNSTPDYLDTVSISLPFRFIVFGLLVILAIALLGFYLYKKFFANKKPAKPVEEIKLPPTPDHVIALRDLNQLYEQYSYSKETMKPVAFGVSQILKNFFSARFKVDARESTTDEMLALLKQESLPESDLKKIRALFQNLDLIKFTDYEHHQHFQKGDYFEFKEHARALIESWAAKGETK